MAKAVGAAPSAVPPPNNAPARVPALALLAVVVLALAVRLVVVAEVSGSPYHRNLVLDAATYHRTAVAGDPREPFWQPPLYPWFLRAVYAVTGPQPIAPRVVQAILGALAAAGVTLLTARVAGAGRTRWALGAGVATALCAPLINADVELLPGGLAAFLIASFALLLLTEPGPAAWRRARPVLLGVLLGLCGILLPTSALAGAVALVWMARREGFGRAALVGLIALLPVLAVAARNYQREPDFVAVSYNGGVNMFLGNSPDYPQSVGIRPGIDWTHLVEKPRCEGGVRTRAEESRWFSAQARAFAAREPATFVRNLAWKAAATLSGREIGRNRDEYAIRGESVVMRVLLWPAVFPTGLLLAAAAVGAFVLLRGQGTDPAPADARSGAVLLLGLALGVLAASVIFFPTARYRVPALPLLVALGAAGLARLGRPDRGTLVRALVPGAVVIAIGLVPHGIPPIPASETFYEIAIDLDQDGKVAEAVPFFEQALALDPDNADAQLGIGLALGKLGREDEGRTHLERATRLAPDADVAWQGLGIYFKRRNDRVQARAAFDKAVTLNPCNRKAAAMYAQALMDEGMVADARRVLDDVRRRYRRGDADVERAQQRLAQMTGGAAAGSRPTTP